MQQKPIIHSINQGMNWNDLRYFLAVVREGSVSGAGRSLGVEHTTVARRINALEEKLGSRLFNRLSHGYELTPTAENLYPHALSVEETMQSAERELFGSDAELGGPLRLTASYDVFNRLITPHLMTFTQRYPSIELELLSSTALADLTSRQADIAVRLTPAPPDYLVGKKVLPLGHGIYASQQYLEQRPAIDQLILWEHEHKTPQWVSQHFPDGRISLRSNEIMSMMEATKAGLGIARLPCYVAESEPSLLRLNLPLSPSNWGIWVLNHIDLRATARVRACREFLIETLLAQAEKIQGSDSRYCEFFHKV